MNSNGPAPAAHQPQRTSPAPPAPRTSSAPAGTDPNLRGPARPIGWGLALIAAGILWLLPMVGVSIRWDLVLPTALIVIGVLLLAGGRWTARSGLVGIGIVVAAFAVAVTVSPASPHFTAGDRTVTVTDLADLQPSYRLGAGSLTLDLHGIELPAGTTQITAEVSMGELVVRVPPDVSVEGHARVILGDVTAFDGSRGGVVPTLALAEQGDRPDRILVLDLRVGLGSIEVQR